MLGYLWWTFKTSLVDDDCRKKPVTVYFCRAIKQTEIRIKAGDWIGKVEPQQKSASVKLQPKYMTAVSARVYVRAHARVPSILLALFFAEPQPPGVLKSIKSNTRLLWCVCVCVCYHLYSNNQTQLFRNQSAVGSHTHTHTLLAICVMLCFDTLNTACRKV